jgi:RsmE family RNA methyltransferase
MRRTLVNLILLEPGELDTRSQAVLTGARAAHLQQVLRARPGQTVRIGLLDGPVGAGVVSSLTPGTVTLNCTFEAEVPPTPAVDLLLALPRPKVVRRLWAQLAAVGVRRIILTNAARVERHYFDTHILTPASYVPLLVEGLQQAQDTRLPIVSLHRQFRPLVEDELAALAGDAIRLIADPHATASVADALRGAHARRVVLAIGPEGGWNAFERQLLEAHAFTSIGMGYRTLRSDTACIALLALVHHELDSQRRSSPL